ncbi:MAG: phosphatidate cytidylyltransferase [Gammaproteobacteria bacterium]|nr:phosphatidate cytidylyltransferase [Gammaproteobacteria bacterium]
MIAGIVSVTLPGFAIGAAVMALANRNATPDTARARWLKLVVFFFIVHLVLGVAAAGQPWVTWLLVAILGAAALELWRAWQRIDSPRPWRVWAVFLAVAASTLWTGSQLPPSAFAFLFIVTATCDGFSQVVGQWLGRTPLAPRLSPGKTVGGLLGGLFAAAAVAVLTRDLLHATAVTAAAVGIGTGLAGLAGDLAASWVKRRAGIKDYSAALPGQGGFLDRFDSLLGALTVTGSILLALP